MAIHTKCFVPSERKDANAYPSKNIACVHSTEKRRKKNKQENEVATCRFFFRMVATDHKVNKI